MIFVCDNHWRCTGCLRKKKEVWCTCSRLIDILRMAPHSNVIFSDMMYKNFHIVRCEISTPYVKHKLWTLEEWVKWDLDDKMTNLNTNVSFKSCLTHHSSCIHNFSYLCYMEWHLTQIKMKVINLVTMSQNIVVLNCTFLKILLICYTVLFWDTRYYTIWIGLPPLPVPIAICLSHMRNIVLAFVDMEVHIVTSYVQLSSDNIFIVQVFFSDTYEKWFSMQNVSKWVQRFGPVILETTCGIFISIFLCTYKWAWKH